MEDVAGLVPVQQVLVKRGQAAELRVHPAGVAGREDSLRQTRHKVHLPRVGDGLQSRNLVHPVRGRRLGLPRGAHAPVLRPTSWGPAAPKTETPGASKCQPCWPRCQRHTDPISSRPPPGRRHLPARKACWEPNLQFYEIILGTRLLSFPVPANILLGQEDSVT